MGFSFKQRGSTRKMEAFLARMNKFNARRILEPYGRQGVDLLAANTPVDSGLAANSWNYEIEAGRSGVTISWTNSNVENGFPVVIALQYGYATGTGGYVAGRDFINPAMKPLFDRLANDIWKEVTSA